MRTPALRILPAAMLALAATGSPGLAEPRLRVDPRLLVELQTVRDVIARDDNPAWPGWNAASTPVLLYIPGVQDVLVGHPHPPDGFVPYRGPLAVPGATVVLRDGPTFLDWDGQNTEREIAGEQTLVIADNTSNLKQTLRGLLEDPRPVENRLADLDYERDLAPDVYAEMTRIAHEAFHVFQARSAPDRGADERDVRLYPCLSVDNNVGFALEGEALAECLRARDDAAARAAAVRWLAIRDDRRAQLPARAIAYEDGNEFTEGVAMYVELALMNALEGRTPDPRLWLYQGFHGFDSSDAYRERKVQRLLQNLRGEVNVNNDPYGTSPVRARLYFSGMAIATLLDRFAPDWKRRLFATDSSLTDLARAGLRPTPDELAAALADARRDPGIPALLAAKQRLAREGRRNTDSMLTAILAGPRTRVVIDWSALPSKRMGLSFTGYGVRAIDTSRTIYTLVPIEAVLSSRRYGFEQSEPLATLEDRRARRFTFALPAPLGPEQRAAIRRASTRPDSLDLRLPGVRLHAARARTRFDGRTVRVEYLPAP